VLWYAESKSVVTVQRNFRRVYQKDAPTVRKWYQQFQETGSVVKGHSPGRPSTSQDDTEHIRVAFQRSPKSSVRHVSRQLHIPKSTVHDVVHRRLKLRAYKL
jgi:transposase